MDRRLDEGLRRDHRDFLYYILRQNEKGAVRRDEIILNSALFMSVFSPYKSRSADILEQCGRFRDYRIPPRRFDYVAYAQSPRLHETLQRDPHLFREGRRHEFPSAPGTPVYERLSRGGYADLPFYTNGFGSKCSCGG
jgi:hypothetical protein